MTVSGPKPFHEDGNYKRVNLGVGLGLLVLILVALAVVFVLPTTIDKEPLGPIKNSENREIKPTRAVSPSANRPPSGAGTMPSLIDKRRKTAERLLKDILREKSLLERDRVTIWGENRLTVSYPEVLQALQQANAAFDSENYLIAIKEFQHVKELLVTLEKSKNKRLIMAIKAGRLAIKNAEARSAETAFSLAVAIQPDNPEALAGLARAASLPSVLKLVEQGRRLELNGHLEAAYRAFRDAANADPAYRPAQKEASRTGRLISEMNYIRAVTEAIQGIDKGKFEIAAIALSKARNIRPHSQELRDLSTQLKQRREDAAIDSLLSNARKAAANENWEKAATQYQKVLTIDPNAASGINGLRLSKRMFLLQNQINNYIKDPDRLNSEEPLKHARQLIKEGKNSLASRPRLASKIKRLNDLVINASVPHTVLLRSDGETHVTVYRIARLGRFIEKSIELTLGKYIAVGTRTGYRDVRVEFWIRGANNTASVIVKCTERI